MAGGLLLLLTLIGHEVAGIIHQRNKAARKMPTSAPLGFGLGGSDAALEPLAASPFASRNASGDLQLFNIGAHRSPVMGERLRAVEESSSRNGSRNGSHDGVVQRSGWDAIEQRSQQRASRHSYEPPRQRSPSL